LLDAVTIGREPDFMRERLLPCTPSAQYLELASVIGTVAAIGHIFLFYLLWRVLGRGHGVLGIVIVVALALLYFGWRYYRRR
jgi:hypothetical protein